MDNWLYNRSDRIPGFSQEKPYRCIGCGKIGSRQTFWWFLPKKELRTLSQGNQ